MEPLKTCAKCRAEKSLSEFSGDPRGSQGLHAYCRECQSAYNRAYHATPEGRSRVLLHDARRRKACTLDRAWVVDRLRRGVCEATGIPFDLQPRTDGGHQNPYAPSLDRIDPSGDYTPENSQLVIFAYNTAKGQLHDDLARPLIRRMGASL